MISPANMKIWTGRADVEDGEHALRWHQVVRPLAVGGKPGVALVGFACDEGVRRNQGRPGARKGPAAIRRLLAGLAAHHARPVYDAGDVTCENEKLEEAQAAFSARVAALLKAGHFPIGLGGGHEIAYATFAGLANHRRASGAAARIGIVNLDSHFDLRHSAHAHSGTSFLQIAALCHASAWPFHYCCLGIAEPANTAALFQRARDLGVVWRTDEQLSLQQWPETLAALRKFSAAVDELYLTICLDVLPACVAPGVSAPAARGVAIEVIESLIGEVKRTGKLTAADIAEMNPDFDLDARTARVAARLIYKIAT